jgi:hypothetical protein
VEPNPTALEASDREAGAVLLLRADGVVVSIKLVFASFVSQGHLGRYLKAENERRQGTAAGSYTVTHIQPGTIPSWSDR